MTARRLTALVLCLLTLTVVAQSQSKTPAGTVIHNRARLVYTEPDGQEVDGQTNVVLVSVAIVNGVVVTPDETSPSGQVDATDTATVSFNVCNTGNNPLAYVVAAASVTAPAAVESVYLDSDASGGVTTGDVLVSLSVTQTPVVPQGECTHVLVRYSTNNAAAQSQLTATLTAHSAPDAADPAQQRVEDSGSVVRTVKDGPRFRDPDDPSLPPRKSVNGVEEVTVSSGAVVEFEVAFRNVGEGRALAARIVDELPAGLKYQPSSLRLAVGAQVTPLSDHRDGDDGEVIGQTVEARVPVVVSQEVVSLRFRALVEPLPGGTLLINRAQVSADNAALVNTRDARVLVAPQGVVFDGGLGSSAPIANASVRVVHDGQQGPPVVFPASGFSPNAENSNPYLTGADGSYSFRVSPLPSTQTYFILVRAEGFKDRIIEARLSPQSSGRFGMRLTSRDGQPICEAGGFSLTDSFSDFDALAALVANVPMFASGGLEISKAADRASASIGDVVTYRVEVTNTSRTPAHAVEVRDDLPQSFFYVPGSGVLTVNGSAPRAVEPEISGARMTFRLAVIPAGARVSLTYRVRIGVNARPGQQYNTAVAINGDVPTPTARVPVLVHGGIFSTTQFIVGRVYVDRNGNGRFDGGDAGVGGARLVTQNGINVITDSAGNYNIPMLNDGPVVIQLDPSTVPAGLAPRDGLRSDGSTWSRLVATPLQGGAMLHAGFALVGDSPSASVAPRVVADGGGRREGSAAAGNAGPNTISEVGPQTPPKPKKRGNFVKRFFGSIFGSKRGDDNARKTAAPNTETARAAVPLAPAVESSSPESAPVPPRAETSVPPPAPQPRLTEIAMVQPVVAYAAAPLPSDAPQADTEQPAAFIPHAAPSPQSTPQLVAANLDESAAPTGEGADVHTAPPAPAGVAAVAPGNVEIDLEPDFVSLKPGLDVGVRVALGWGIKLFVNDRPVDVNRVGERRVDQSSQSESHLYIGLDLAPGPNRLRAVAVSPDGREGGMREVVVYGRGPAKHLTLAPALNEIAAGRRASTEIVVRALDEWENPALDGDVVLVTTAGAFNPSGSELQQQVTVKLRDGLARVQLVSADTPGTASLRAVNGTATAQGTVRFGAEKDAPAMLVGFGNLAVGRAAPVMNLRGVDGERARGSLGFFYRGRIYDDHVLTLSYDSQRPLQRYDAQDRLFQIDPLEFNYKVFGDSSTRYSAAPSNSKVYARLDLGREYGRSFLLFGDHVPERRDTELAAYNRRLTGAQIHFENSHGDYVSFGGAHPDTVFGRDVFPGGIFGFARLSATSILPGSETVSVEVRDRRNPDLLVNRELLTRGVDYNLDPDAGQIFFKRIINGFDADLNLRQIVVTYEYRASGKGTMIFTARASKKFRSTGTRLGFSVNLQQQGRLGNYALGGVDFTQETPNGGELHLEYARSTGKVGATGTYYTGSLDDDRQGNAYLATYNQPFEWRNSRLQASFRRAGAGFYNPFGPSVLSGAQRAGASFDLQASPSARLRFGFTDERNKTEQVNNSRQTFGAQLTKSFSDNLTATFAYDYRRLLTNEADGESEVTNSHLVTAGVEWRPTSKLTLSARREQNLAESDPTYPNQTTFSASYQLNDVSRLFATQRLSSAPISPISDLTGAGFAFSTARREFTAGIETKLLGETSLLGGYRLENDLNGSDGYAVLGLARTFKLSETLSLDGSFERAFHLSGQRAGGYNTLSSGFTWKPRADFIANTSYQWRTRDGGAHAVAAGFAGKPFDSVTAIGNFQWTQGSNYASVGSPTRDGFDAGSLAPGGKRRGMYGSFGFALRPKDSDRVGAFFNYQHRSFTSEQGASASAFSTRERSSTFSADAFLQALSRVTLFGKAAVKRSDNARDGIASSPTLTYLLQGRTEYRVAPQFDFALEGRYLAQPATGSSRFGVATELGYWLTPDFRAGVGYNFTRADDPGRPVIGGNQRGAYFTFTTKFERLFDFLGGRKKEGK